VEAGGDFGPKNRRTTDLPKRPYRPVGDKVIDFFVPKNHLRFQKAASHTDM
jgi:hypothetical protein